MSMSGYNTASKTSIYFGPIEKRYIKDNNELLENQGGKGEVYNSISDIALEPGRASNDKKVYFQQRMTEDYVTESLEIYQRISSGGFGIVFHCRFDTKMFVIKLPRKMVERNLLTIDQGKLTMHSHEKSDKDSRYITQKSKLNFSEEVKFARMALEPKLEQEREVGEPIPEQTFTSFLKIQNQRRRMKEHPGFKHIHRIVHFEPNYPFILSETCIGSAEHFPINHHHCISIARDIGKAIVYIEEIAGFYHLDIKEQNILFKRSDTGDICWVLSDFGVCIETSQPSDVLRNQSHGTLYLNRCEYVENDETTHTHAYVVCILGFIFLLVEAFLRAETMSIPKKFRELRTNITMLQALSYYLREIYRSDNYRRERLERDSIWKDCVPFLKAALWFNKNPEKYLKSNPPKIIKNQFAIFREKYKF